MRTICPICQMRLGKNDRLIAEWSDQMQWFVLRHYKDVTTDEETVGGVKNFSGRTWCGHANHSAVRSLTTDWRAEQEKLREEARREAEIRPYDETWHARDLGKL